MSAGLNIIISEGLCRLMMPSLRSAFGQNTGVRNPELEIQKVITFSNIGDQLDRLHETQEELVDQQFTELSSDRRERLLVLLRTHFDRNSIIEQIVSTALKQPKWPFVSEYLSFHETSFYARMNNLEVAARNLRPELIRDFDLESISQSRKDSIKKIIFDFNLLKQAFDFQSCILVPIVVLSNLINGLNRTQNVDSIEQMIRNFCFSDEHIMLSLKHTGMMYLQASDEELSRYASFHASEGTIWVYSMLYEGMKRGFEKCLKAAENDALAAAM